MNNRFRTVVSPGVYWVPYSVLRESSRKTQYCMSKGHKNNDINSLTDAISAFTRLDFEEIDDTSFVLKKGLNWEMHVGGKEVIEKSGGCCSTISAWVFQVLHGIYEEVGFFCLYRNTGSGHVLNYIVHQNKKYVIDFLPFLKEYRAGLCEQTGERSDFLKVKYFTGLLYEVESFNHFANYYSRMTLMSGVKQIFWVYSAETVSPIAVKEDDGIKYVYIPDCYKVQQVGKQMPDIQLISLQVNEFDMKKYKFI